VLALPEDDAGDAKRAAKLERDLERTRATVKEQRGRIAALVRVEDQMRAVAVFDAAAEIIRSRPPPGVDAGYVSAFLARHRQALIRLVGRAI
jgi:hypothetical protein